MTETELNRQIEVSEQQRAELLVPQPKRRTGRAYRRMMNERKFRRLYRIVTSSYIPHAGYTSWSYVNGQHVPIGTYIKYPKNSSRQRWCKRHPAPVSENTWFFPARVTAIAEYLIIGGRCTDRRKLTSVDVREEDAVGNFAVSRRVLGLERRKK